MPRLLQALEGVAVHLAPPHSSSRPQRPARTCEHACETYLAECILRTLLLGRVSAQHAHGSLVQQRLCEGEDRILDDSDPCRSRTRQDAPFAGAAGRIWNSTGEEPEPPGISNLQVAGGRSCCAGVWGVFDVTGKMLRKDHFSRRATFQEVAFREKWLFRDATRANNARKVTFRKKWLFEKSGFSRTPRAPTSREKWLFEQNGLSRKVAFREKWLFRDAARANAARKVTFREKWLFEKSGFSRTLRAPTSREKWLFEQTGFSRKVTFREKWLFRDAARANAARKVTFREKWLFRDAARANAARKVTFREKEVRV